MADININSERNRWEFGRFTTINGTKYEHFTRKINRIYWHLVCTLWFPAFSAVLSLLCHHYYSSYKTKSGLHSTISTFVHAEVVCTSKILPIGIFLSQSWRSKNTAKFIVGNWPYFVPHTIPITCSNSQRFLSLLNAKSNNTWRFHELIVWFFSRRELRTPVVNTVNKAYLIWERASLSFQWKVLINKNETNWHTSRCQWEAKWGFSSPTSIKITCLYPWH